MRHPPHDLTPEPVMIRVFDAFAPAPRRVGAHVEHLATASAARREERDAARRVARRLVHREDFRAGLCLHDRRVPEKSRQPAPHRLVRARIRREHREPVVASAESQLKLRLACCRESAACREVHHARALFVIRLHRHEIPERRIFQRPLPAERAGQKDEAARLLFDQSAQHRCLLGRDHAFRHADIAEEDHIVALQIFALCRERREIPRALAHADLRMEEHRVHLHAGVAHERIPQVAEFPPRLRIHDEHLQRLLAHRHVEFLLVVLRKNFVLLHRHLHREVCLALRRRRDDDHVLNLRHRRNGHRLRARRAARPAHRHGRLHLAVEMILQRHKHADALIQQPVSRREHALQFEVREIILAARAERKNRHILLRQRRRAGDGRLAEIPVAIREQQHRAEIRVRLPHAF